MECRGPRKVLVGVNASFISVPRRRAMPCKYRKPFLGCDLWTPRNARAQPVHKAPAQHRCECGALPGCVHLRACTCMRCVRRQSANGAAKAAECWLERTPYRYACVAAAALGLWQGTLSASDLLAQALSNECKVAKGLKRGTSIGLRRSDGSAAVPCACSATCAVVCYAAAHRRWLSDACAPIQRVSAAALR